MKLPKKLKETIREQCLGLENNPKIKNAITKKDKNGYIIQVILDSKKEVYFLTDNNFILASTWYYQKENIIDFN